MGEYKEFKVDYLFFEKNHWFWFSLVAIAMLIGAIVYLVTIASAIKYFFNITRIDFSYGGLIILSFFFLLSVGLKKWVFPHIELDKIEINGNTLFFHRKKTKKVYEVRFEDIRELNIKITRDIIKDEDNINNYVISTGDLFFSIIVLRKSKLLLTDEFHLELSEKLNLNSKPFNVKNLPGKHPKSELIMYKL